MDHTQLIQFLKERNLAALLKEAEAIKMTGDDFVADLDELKKRFPGDHSTLERLVGSDPVLWLFVCSVRLFSAHRFL